MEQASVSKLGVLHEVTVGFTLATIAFLRVGCRFGFRHYSSFKMAERPFDAGSLTKNVSGDYDQHVCYKCKKSNAIHHGKRCDKHFICAKCFVSHNKQEDFCDHHSAFPLQPSVTPGECPDAPVHLPLAPNKCITHPENDQRSKFKVEVSLQSRQYKIGFTPITRGPHQLHVKVHDIDIPGSPFSIPVSEKEVNLQENPNSVKKDECILSPTSDGGFGQQIGRWLQY